MPGVQGVCRSVPVESGRASDFKSEHRWEEGWLQISPHFLLAISSESTYRSRLRPEGRPGMGKSVKKASRRKRGRKAQTQDQLPLTGPGQSQAIPSLFPGTSAGGMGWDVNVSAPSHPNVQSHNIVSYPLRDLEWMGQAVSLLPSLPHLPPPPTQPLPKTSNIFFHK